MTERTCVIGNFDGVHRGHIALMRAAQAIAPEAELVAITFWPHPMSVVRPDKAPKLLCDLPTRQALLTTAGACEVHVVDFTPKFASCSPREFVERVLVPLDVQHVVVGENFRFGFRASGSVSTLAELGTEFNFDAVGIGLLKVSDEETCSTAIRHALAEGDLDTATQQLGRWISFRGVVVHGAKRGRTLGFPTANLFVPDWLAVPADGVYAGWAQVIGEGAERWPVAVSVGTNPTFDGLERTIESYVLDRTDLDLYDLMLEVSFVKRLRGMVKFDGLEPLIEQMREDVVQTRVALGLPGPVSEECLRNEGNHDHTRSVSICGEG